MSDDRMHKQHDRETSAAPPTVPHGFVPSPGGRGQSIGRPSIKRATSGSSCSARSAWVLAWLFLLFVVGHLALVLYFNLPTPQGRTRLYYAESAHGVIEPFGMVFEGWSGVAQAMIELVGHVSFMLMAVRARGRWRRLAFFAMTVWALIWVVGIGRVMLNSREWLLFGPWLIVPVLGAIACGWLVINPGRDAAIVTNTARE